MRIENTEIKIALTVNEADDLMNDYENLKFGLEKGIPICDLYKLFPAFEKLFPVIGMHLKNKVH